MVKTINGETHHVRRVIDGKVYDTRKAERVMHIPCHRYGDDFKWENTDLYRSPGKRWFLAGIGNAHSRWAANQADGPIGGDGVELLTEDEVKALFEEHDGPFEAYFETEEG